MTAVVRKIIGSIILPSCGRSPLALPVASGTANDLTAGLEQLQPLLHEGLAVDAELTVLVLAQSVEATA